jgi:membrane protein required for colicin V production
MTWFDYTVIAIVGISVLLSLIHGLVREIFSLVSWVAAFVVAQIYVTDVAQLLPPTLSNPSLRLLIGFIAVFITTLLIMTLVAIALSKLIRTAGLGFADRALGALFGLMRGMAIVMIGILVAGLTSLPHQPAWRHAMFSPQLVAVANMLKVWLPYDLEKHINYG